MNIIMHACANQRMNIIMHACPNQRRLGSLCENHSNTEQLKTIRSYGKLLPVTHSLQINCRTSFCLGNEWNHNNASKFRERTLPNVFIVRATSANLPDFRSDTQFKCLTMTSAHRRSQVGKGPFPPNFKKI